jgi:hypothetical protein
VPLAGTAGGIPEVQSLPRVLCAFGVVGLYCSPVGGRERGPQQDFGHDRIVGSLDHGINLLVWVRADGELALPIGSLLRYDPIYGEVNTGHT